MHIPDGMLEARTWIPAWLGSAGVLGYAVKRVREKLSDAKIVMMAVLAALIFALQMLNFPVAGGTSGHFAGGAMAAIILGPWPAMLSMAAVLTVQALFFGDGGITTLGANFMNMAIIGPAVGWAVYRGLTTLSQTRAMKLAASAVAGWSACFIGALSAGAMLWASGRVPLAPALATMGGWHAVIGIGEGVITAGIVSYLLAVRPDLLAGGSAPENPAAARRTASVFGGVALLAAALSFAASSHPDGLEYVYGKLGSAVGRVTLFRSPFADYSVGGVGNDALAGVLAGVIGVIVTGALAYALLSAAHRRRDKSADK